MLATAALRAATVLVLAIISTGAARATDYYAAYGALPVGSCTDPAAPCDLAHAMFVSTGPDIRIHIAPSPSVYSPQFTDGSKSMTLIGAGRDATSIGASSSVPNCAITVTTGSVTLQDLKLAPGTGCCSRGVCMTVPDGATAGLALNRVAVQPGGGSRGIDAVTMGSGSANIAIIDSVFSGNADGAIVLTGNGNLQIDRTSLINNWGNSFTTAPLQVSGVVTTSVRNSTFSGNFVDGGVGGISHASTGLLTLSHVTLAGNSGTALSGNVASIDHTIIEGVCQVGGVLGGGYSIESPGSTCGLAGSSLSAVTAAALALGPLADNGGLTPTMLPQAGSVAIDIGGSPCAPVDQRNLPRIPPCDAGAVEVSELLFESGFEGS
jgi:hypothetical protein